MECFGSWTFSLGEKKRAFHDQVPRACLPQIHFLGVHVGLFPSMLPFQHPALTQAVPSPDREEILAWKIRYTSRSWAQQVSEGWLGSRMLLLSAGGGVSDWKAPGSAFLSSPFSEGSCGLLGAGPLQLPSPAAVWIVPLQLCLCSSFARGCQESYLALSSWV